MFPLSYLLLLVQWIFAEKKLIENSFDDQECNLHSSSPSHSLAHSHPRNVCFSLPETKNVQFPPRPPPTKPQTSQQINKPQNIFLLFGWNALIAEKVNGIDFLILSPLSYSNSLHMSFKLRCQTSAFITLPCYLDMPFLSSVDQQGYLAKAGSEHSSALLVLPDKPWGVQREW